MNTRRKVISAMLMASLSLFAGSKVTMEINQVTGAISQLRVDGDITGMDWLTKTDGSQYPWLNSDYGWGLGYTTVTKGHISEKVAWSKPESILEGGKNVTYRLGDLSINVSRNTDNGEITENYTFTNKGRSVLSLSETGIYTPFNDNYPDAQQCVNGRANAHIWNGESAAYINALRMGGFAPHTGVVFTEGEKGNTRYGMRKS